MTIRDVLDAAKSRLKSSIMPVTMTTNWPGVPVANFPEDGTYWTASVRDILEMTPAQLWRGQPHLRMVIDFLARNIAQLGLPAYVLQADGDRQRTTTDVAAQVFRRPNAHMTRYELIFALIGDLALYQSAYWLINEDSKAVSGWTIAPIPAAWVQGTEGDADEPTTYIVTPPNGQQRKVPARLVERFHGWDPNATWTGASPVETLKATLAETRHAQVYREQQWKRGGRVGAVISRPPGHRWTQEQENKFMLAFRDAYAGDDSPAGGGIPILQDGMTMTRLGFSAKEDEYIEGTKLALSTVAGVYHVNPTMLGQLDNANYSNVREFRRMLYGDTLGPWLSQLEDRLNAFVLPRFGSDQNVFVEFNIAEKLQGSFEEQAAVMSTSVGAPWMTRNEGRKLQNLPAIDGGDELITPLNVLIGAQASPQDGGDGTQDAVELVAARVFDMLKRAEMLAKQRKSLTSISVTPSVKTDVREAHTASTTAALIAFFESQKQPVLSRLGAHPDDFWHEERWDKELADVLFAQAAFIAGEIGPAAALELGFDANSYHAEQTAAFLFAVAQSRAAMINATTRAQIDDALADTENEDHTAASVFAIAVGARALTAGQTLTTTFTTFATTEAAKQVAPGKSMKTWHTTTAKPRPEHARMNGEQVPTEGKFSNGAEWPGDPHLGADGVAGCECIVSIQLVQENE